MENINDITQIMEMAKEYSKEPELYIYFGAEDDFENMKRVKFIPKFSGYTLENMIKVIESKNPNIWGEFLARAKKEIKLTISIS